MKDNIEESKLAKLRQLAISQKGMFTTRQAQEIGYSVASQSYHAKKNNWVRNLRGIYSLPEFSVSDNENFVEFSLWSHDKGSNPAGVISFDSALEYYGLSDVQAYKTHMSVGAGFRKYASAPKGLCLHKSNLVDGDCAFHDGYKITTPLRTYVDVLTSKDYSDDIVDSIILDGINTNKIAPVDFEMSPLLRKEILTITDHIKKLIQDNLDDSKLRVYLSRIFTAVENNNASKSESLALKGIGRPKGKILGKVEDISP